MPTSNGRNQESTSESINAYYAIYAYASAVDAPFAKRLKDFGRIMTAMEVHGADTYWHVRSSPDIYGTEFPFNHTTVGMVWSNMVNYQTFFGMTTYFVEGIHLLPMTPVMESYLKADWMSKQFAPYKAACDADPQCAKAGFSWQVCLEQALIDTGGAVACLRALPRDAFSPDNTGSCGNSLTNSLYWIATRLPPTAAPSSSVPMPPCDVGMEVRCPGTSATCSGGACCMDGSTCPSADPSFRGCEMGKTEDCIRSGLAETFLM